jgi:hypothetical protein
MRRIGWLPVLVCLLAGVAAEAGSLTDWAGGDCKAIVKQDASNCR